MSCARRTESCERMSKIDPREQKLQREADRRVARGESVMRALGVHMVEPPDGSPDEIDDVLEKLDR